MSIIEEKYQIIQKIINLDDRASLEKISRILEKGIAANSERMTLETFYDKVEESEKDYKAGKFTSQEDLKKEVKKWGKKG